MSQILLQPANAMITLENVNKWYGQFHVLKNINLTVQPGERIVLCGPSGSGKSTTIRCINHLEEHQQGRIVVDGIELNEDIRNIERVRQEVGMVFQHFNLFPHLTVLENITLGPRKLRKMPTAEANALAERLLKHVGLSDKRDAYPSQLSGGQQQRVAIGRALITRPSLILADEPTGNLDSQNSSEVIALLKETSKKYEQTIIMITHNRSIAQTADRVLQVSDGTLTDFGRCRE